MEPININDYCSFSSSNTNDDWIIGVHIKNQKDEVLVNTGPYGPISGGHRDETHNIIYTTPGDILTISITIGSLGYNQFLSWGHTIYDQDLVTIDDLANSSDEEWTHTYTWEVPDEPGTYLVAWWQNYNSYTTGCGSKSYAERHSFTLFIDENIKSAHLEFETLVPSVTTNCPRIKASISNIECELIVPKLSLLYDINITYNHRESVLSDDDLELIDYIESRGASVSLITDSQLETYDFSNTDVLIVGRHASTHLLHNYINVINDLDIPIICLSQRTAIEQFGMGDSLITSSTTSSYQIIEPDHPIITGSGVTSLAVGTNTYAAIRDLAPDVTSIINGSTVAGRSVLAERTQLTKNAVTQKIIFWGLFRWETLHDDFKRIFRSTILYVNSFSQKEKQIGRTSLQPLLPYNIQRKYPGLIDVNDYCAFRNDGSSVELSRIDQMLITDQEGRTLLDVGPYATHTEDGHRDNTDYVIFCRPYDTLTITLRIQATAWTASSRYLSWGHTIFTEGLVTVDDLAHSNGSTWIHEYEWVVPNEPGVYLVAWWMRMHSYTHGCDTDNYGGERHSYALWVLPPNISFIDVEPLVPALVWANSFFVRDYENDTSDTSFEGLAPVVSGKINKWIGKKVVFCHWNFSLQEEELIYIERLEADYGIVVATVQDYSLDQYDFSDTDLVIVSAYGTGIYPHRRPRTLQGLKIPILSMRNYTSANVLSFATGGSTVSYSTITIQNSNHPITKGLSGSYSISTGGSYGMQYLHTPLTSGTLFLTRAGSHSSRVTIAAKTDLIDGILYDRVHFGIWRASTHNRMAWFMFERCLSYLLQPNNIANSIVEGLSPRIVTPHNSVQVPFKKTKVVYFFRPGYTTHDTVIVNFLQSLGYDVYYISLNDIWITDLSDTAFIVVGGHITGMLSSHTGWYYLYDIKLPIIIRSNNLAHSSSFGFQISSATPSSITRNHLIVADENHPINKNYSSGDVINISNIDITLRYAFESNLHSDANNIMGTSTISRSVVPEKFDYLGTDLTPYPRLYLGITDIPDLNDSGWEVMERLFNYCAPVYSDILVEAFAPTVNYIFLVNVISEFAEFGVEGYAPTITANASLSRPAEAITAVEGYAPNILADVFIRPNPTEIGFNGILPSIELDLYKGLYLPIDINDYCSFDGGTLTLGVAYIRNILVKDQHDNTLLVSGYSWYHPDRWRVNVDQIIKAQPGDVLDISVWIDHSRAGHAYTLYLYWGNSIHTADLSMTGVLWSGSVTGDAPFRYDYTWEVPDVKGSHLMSWAVRRGTMSSLCGAWSYAERHDHALWIGSPSQALPYYVFMGDVGSARGDKTLMPMLGGFLTIDNAKIEKSDRLSGGMLVSDVSSNKKKFIVEFQNMLSSDYKKWIAEQSLDKHREIEIFNRQGSSTKYIADFIGSYSHMRLKTVGKWVYGQISFILEEV